jgi:transcriptional regulator with XRE-family HTH domain
MRFGQNLRALREARGWSGNELSRRSGLRQSAINRLENAKAPNPTMRILVTLAKTLEVSLDTLVGDEVENGFCDRMEAIEKRLDALERRRD